MRKIKKARLTVSLETLRRLDPAAENERKPARRAGLRGNRVNNIAQRA
jgi:hypothetical protein